MQTVLRGRFDIASPSYFQFSFSLIENIQTSETSGIYVSSDGANFSAICCIFRNCTSSNSYGSLVSQRSKVFIVSMCCFYLNSGWRYPNLFIYDDSRYSGSTAVSEVNMTSLCVGHSKNLGDYISAKELSCRDINSSNVNGECRFCSISFCWFLSMIDPSKFPSIKRVSVCNVKTQLPVIELGFIYQSSVSWEFYNFNIKNCTTCSVFRRDCDIYYIFNEFILEDITSNNWFDNLNPKFVNSKFIKMSEDLIQGVYTTGIFNGTSFYVPGNDSCNHPVYAYETKKVKRGILSLIVLDFIA